MELINLVDILNFLTTNPFSVGTIIVLFFLGGVYLISNVRRQDMKILRDTNEDAIKRIKQLEEKGIEQDNEIISLKQKVEALEKKNKTLEDLVITALKQYFFENPNVAKTLEKVMKNENF